MAGSRVGVDDQRREVANRAPGCQRLDRADNERAACDRGAASVAIGSGEGLGTAASLDDGQMRTGVVLKRAAERAAPIGNAYRDR